MAEAIVGAGATPTVARADALLARGEVHAAIDVLTGANRIARCAELEQALVRVRSEGCGSLPPPSPTVHREPIVAEPGDGELLEVEAADLTVRAIREGFARSGCLLVRGLVPPDRVASLVDGIDATLRAYEMAEAGDESYDHDWYCPFPMPELISPANAGDAVIIPAGAPPAGPIPPRAHRRLTRKAGGVWTVDSPRMLFEWLEVVDDVGIGPLMTELLGERPFLSANKCTLRRVPPEEMSGGWHQDGAFLGEDVAAFNFWLTLTRCGRDAPGLDLVPKRFDRLLESGSSEAYFKWSLSDADVAAASGGTPAVRPDFEAGDALLFDHRLVHRTGTSRDMTRDRHAVESWFFAPSAFPASQLPIVY